MNLISIRNFFKAVTICKTIIRSKKFQVPIGNAKCVESFKFQNDAQILKYCQKNFNSSCISSLASTFATINHNAADNAIAMIIEESLKSEVGNRIDFANDILKNQKINEGELKVHYNLIK